MKETAKQRTDRLMGMSHAQLIMHAQDLTKQRDDIVRLLEEITPTIANAGAFLRIKDALASVEGEKE